MSKSETEFKISVNSFIALFHGFIDYYSDGRKYTSKVEEEATHATINGKCYNVVVDIRTLCFDSIKLSKELISKGVVTSGGLSYYDDIIAKTNQFISVFDKDHYLAIQLLVGLKEDLGNLSFSGYSEVNHAIWSDVGEVGSVRIRCGKQLVNMMQAFEGCIRNYVPGCGPMLNSLASEGAVKFLEQCTPEVAKLYFKLWYNLARRIETDVNKKLSAKYGHLHENVHIFDKSKDVPRHIDKHINNSNRKDL